MRRTTVGLLLLVAALAVIPIFVKNDYWGTVLDTGGTFAIVAVGLNLLCGGCGQFSLGHGGFFAIGAFTAGILSTHGWPFWLDVPAGGLVAAAAGLVVGIPVLRLSGPYFAIATLAVGLLVDDILGTADWAAGRTGIALNSPSLGNYTFTTSSFFWVVLAVLAAGIFVAANLRNGSTGRAFAALRDAQPAALSSGVSSARYRVIAFAISTLYSGMAGGLLAHWSLYINAASFGLSLSILFIAMIVIGGLDSVVGSVVGAAFLVALQEWLQNAGHPELANPLYGAMLVVTLLFLPGGLVGLAAILRHPRVAILLASGAPRRIRWAPSGRPVAAPAPGDGSRQPTAPQPAAPVSTTVCIAPGTTSPLGPVAGHRAGPTPLLEVRGLTLHFGGLRALDGVDLDVAEGTITGLIGPNGAGKTSLLNCICRFYRPRQGEMVLAGQSLLRRPAHGLAGLGVARTFQQIELFGSMSALENVQVGAHNEVRPAMLAEALGLPAARGPARRQRQLACEILDLLDLGSVAHQPALSLPLSLQKRVGVARALACRPRLLLLDEPAGGLSMTEKQELAGLLRSLCDRLGLTILLVEHDMDLVMRLCDAITVLDFGRCIAAGPPAAVQSDPAVVAAYLGVASEDGAKPAAGAQRPAAVTEVHAPVPAQPARTLLEVRGLCVQYGRVVALDDLSLRIEEGQAVAVLGANGAGKSSMLRTIGGLQRAEAGQIILDGERIERRSAAELVDRGLCLVPDTKELFPRFTVAENLRMGAHRRPSRDYDIRRDEVLALFPALQRRLNAPAWQLSGGERQMLALGRALLARPRLLLLDEPSLGLAPLVVESIFQALATIVARGTALLLVEQSTVGALKLAGYAYVLRTGRLALEGPSAELLHDPRVIDLYLGGEAPVWPMS
jgi:ABC-type branched-subunit amino acid transport system ATPase component/ABC-type branched-subunit amino acid transport system permease subunit